MSKPKKSAKFWWFEGDSVDEITANLVAAGPGARLEVHLNGDDMTVFVVPEIAVADGGGGGTNDSHVCPPSCP